MQSSSESEGSPPSAAADIAWNHGDDACAIVRAGAFTAVNPAFGRLVGRPSTEVVGLQLRDVFAARDVASLLGPTDLGVGARPLPVAGLLGNGHPFLAELSAVPAPGDEMIVRARRRGPSITVDADPPNATSSPIATALSHDVRGRVGVVSGFLDLAMTNDGDTPPGQHAHLVERAARATETVDRMLEQLVDFVRLGEAVFHLAPTPLDTLVTEAATHVDVDISVTSAPLPIAFAHRELLTECVAELFRNAIEFASDTPPTIEVSATVVDGWCELSIADNGRGIQPELTDKSVGLFQQLQSRNWERGTGMGLAICDRIIDGHGGTMTLSSDGVAGTTVVLRLALAEMPATSLS